MGDKKGYRESYKDILDVNEKLCHLLEYLVIKDRSHNALYAFFLILGVVCSFWFGYLMGVN